MRIGIDARFFGPTTGGGGIGRYVEELITHLQIIDQENDYVLFLKKDNFHECKITNHRFKKVMADVHWYGLREQFTMPRLIKRARLDFIHYPHWNIPLFSPIPFFVTIHDLILIEDRHSARSSSRNPIIHGFKYAAFRTVLETAIHSSRHIFTVSNYSKQSLLKHFGIKPEKITVTYNGIKQFSASKSVDLYKLGVYEPYFLYVGNAYPHKNLDVMLEAFALFSKKTPHIQMVIAGRRDIFSHALEKRARTLGIKNDRLRFIDLPTDEEIATLYKKAALFVYPSRLEGFGMPPLEALMHSTPVAAAHASSLPEILGNAAIYFDPDRPDQLTKIMQDISRNSSALTVDREEAKKQISLYNWEDTAQRTLDVYTSFSKRK